MPPAPTHQTDWARTHARTHEWLFLRENYTREKGSWKLLKPLIHSKFIISLISTPHVFSFSFFSLLSNQWKPQSQCFVDCSWRGKFKKREKKFQERRRIKKTQNRLLWLSSTTKELTHKHYTAITHTQRRQCQNAAIDKHCPVMNCIIFWQDEWKCSVALTFPLNSSNDGGK